MSVKPVCASIECKNEAHLQCPTCVKLSLNEGSFFCSQDCFKKSWVQCLIQQFVCYMLDLMYSSTLSIFIITNRALIKLFMATPSVRNWNFFNFNESRLITRNNFFFLFTTAAPYEPFKNFKYSGPLRAVYPLSPRRTVPKEIQRPDYAETGK